MIEGGPEKPADATSGKVLSFAELVAAPPVTDIVYVPELKGAIRLRVLPANEWLDLQDLVVEAQKTKQSKGKDAFEVTYLILEACIIDEAGHQMFVTEEQRKQLRKLFSPKVLIRLGNAANALQAVEPSAKNG